MRIEATAIPRHLTRTPLSWVATTVAAAVAASSLHGNTWWPQRAVCLLALPSLLGLLRPVWLRETGLLLARSGVVVSLLVAQLEASSSDDARFERTGAWLAIALGFAALVLLIHLVAHSWRAEDEARRRTAEDARHAEVLAAIRAITTPRPRKSSPQVIARTAGALLIALVVHHRSASGRSATSGARRRRAGPRGPSR